MTRFVCAAAAALMVFLCSAARADEGMWTFHGFPFAKANTRAEDQSRPGMARPRALRHRAPVQLHGHLRVERRPDPHQPSLRRSLPRRALVEGKELRRRRLPREDPRGRKALPDAGGRRAHRHGRNHREGLGGHRRQGRDRRERRCASPRSRSSKANARRRRRRNARPSRCTRAASTGCTSTSATPTCASCSRRNPASRRSAATPTTSSFRAGVSTWACCAPTKTASRRSPRTSSRSTSPGPRRATRCSCPDIPAPPIACSRWRSSSSSAISTCRSGCCATRNSAAGSSSSRRRARRTSASPPTCSTASKTPSRCAARCSTRCTKTRCWRARPPNRKRCAGERREGCRAPEEHR